MPSCGQKSCQNPTTVGSFQMRARKPLGVRYASGFPNAKIRLRDRPEISDCDLGTRLHHLESRRSASLHQKNVTTNLRIRLGPQSLATKTKLPRPPLCSLSLQSRGAGPRKRLGACASRAGLLLVRHSIGLQRFRSTHVGKRLHVHRIMLPEVFS